MEIYMVLFFFLYVHLFDPLTLSYFNQILAKIMHVNCNKNTTHIIV